MSDDITAADYALTVASLGRRLNEANATIAQQAEQISVLRAALDLVDQEFGDPSRIVETVGVWVSIPCRQSVKSALAATAPAAALLDFQVKQQTDANATFPGAKARSAIGITATRLAALDAAAQGNGGAED